MSYQQQQKYVLSQILQAQLNKIIQKHPKILNEIKNLKSLLTSQKDECNLKYLKLRTKYQKIKESRQQLKEKKSNFIVTKEQNFSKSNKQYQKQNKKLNRLKSCDYILTDQLGNKDHLSATNQRLIKNTHQEKHIILNNESKFKEKIEDNKYLIQSLKLILPQAKQIKSMFKQILSSGEQQKNGQFHHTKRQNLKITSLIKLSQFYNEFYKNLKSISKNFILTNIFLQNNINKDNINKIIKNDINDQMIINQLLEDLKKQTLQREKAQQKLQLMIVAMRKGLQFKDQSIVSNFQNSNMILTHTNGHFNQSKSQNNPSQVCHEVQNDIRSVKLKNNVYQNKNSQFNIQNKFTHKVSNFNTQLKFDHKLVSNNKITRKQNQLYEKQSLKTNHQNKKTDRRLTFGKNQNTIQTFQTLLTNLTINYDLANQIKHKQKEYLQIKNKQKEYLQRIKDLNQKLQKQNIQKRALQKKLHYKNKMLQASQDDYKKMQGEVNQLYKLIQQKQTYFAQKQVQFNKNRQTKFLRLKQTQLIKEKQTKSKEDKQIQLNIKKQTQLTIKRQNQINKKGNDILTIKQKQNITKRHNLLLAEQIQDRTKNDNTLKVKLNQNQTHHIRIIQHCEDQQQNLLTDYINETKQTKYIKQIQAQPQLQIQTIKQAHAIRQSKMHTIKQIQVSGINQVQQANSANKKLARLSSNTKDISLIMPYPPIQVQQNQTLNISNLLSPSKSRNYSMSKQANQIPSPRMFPRKTGYAHQLEKNQLMRLLLIQAEAVEKLLAEKDVTLNLEESQLIQ